MGGIHISTLDINVCYMFVFDVRLLLLLFYSYFVDESKHENSSNNYMYITTLCCKITR